MWSRRISSGAPKYPQPRDVIRVLLSRMVEHGIDTSWTHLELVATGGWFFNLLSGRESWIEVALLKAQRLELNPGIRKSKMPLLPALPEKWHDPAKRTWVAPLSEIEEVIGWVDASLAAAAEKPDYRISGWIEGL